jgi:RNase H-fold protein (predicted Holliday junction resolvase)
MRLTHNTRSDHLLSLLTFKKKPSRCAEEIHRSKNIRGRSQAKNTNHTNDDSIIERIGTHKNMIATKLSSALVSPSKVAGILDWRRSVGAVMGLDITKDRIGIAVAEHPENFAETAALKSLSLPRKNRELSRDAIAELEAMVRQHNVCAFVVNWPLNEGRTGEQCGKTLQVLDCLIDQSNSLITRKRPFTLWGNRPSTTATDSFNVDEWGRSADFARAPEYFDGMSYSSKNVFVNHNTSDPANVAAGVLRDWIKCNWVVDSKMGKATPPKKPASNYFFSAHSVDEYNNESACLKAALL